MKQTRIVVVVAYERRPREITAVVAGGRVESVHVFPAAPPGTPIGELSGVNGVPAPTAGQSDDGYAASLLHWEEFLRLRLLPGYAEWCRRFLLLLQLDRVEPGRWAGDLRAVRAGLDAVIRGRVDRIARRAAREVVKRELAAAPHRTPRAGSPDSPAS